MNRHVNSIYEKDSEISKGYLYQLATGGQLANLTQPGNSGLLVGIACYGVGQLYANSLPQTATGYGSLADANNNTALVSLSVNSNLLLDNIPLGSLIPYNNPKMDLYYPVNRVLTGRDNITFQGNAQGANEQIAILLYFANFARKPTE